MLQLVVVPGLLGAVQPRLLVCGVLEQPWVPQPQLLVELKLLEIELEMALGLAHPLLLLGVSRLLLKTL